MRHHQPHEYALPNHHHPRGFASVTHSRLADELVAILWSEDEFAVVEQHLVRSHHARRHALVSVEQLDDLTLLPAVAGTALDDLPDAEAQVLYLLLASILFEPARLELRFKLVLVKVLTDEDELRVALLVRSPFLVEVAVEDHVHRLVDKLLVRLGDGENTLHAVDVCALVLQQIAHPGLHQVKVHFAFLKDAQAGDSAVVRVVAVGSEELRVHIEHALEVEAANVEDGFGRHVRLLAALDGCKLVDSFEPSLDAHQVLLAHQVNLVEQHTVGKCNLLDRLVLRTLGLFLVQVLLDMLRIDQRHDAVEPCEALDIVVDIESLCDGGRISHASRLDQDSIELQFA
mmetsp:Transcript_49368/g.105448  ORF Transcript_49368/g.105448 Transcript_49368/m.105448 type:complete len:344 (+) Transcript_49368:513-1544(+)